MMAKPEKLRRQVRRAFTKTYNDFKETVEDKSESFNLNSLKVLFTSLEDKAERLFKLDSEVADETAALSDEEKANAEFDRAETYRDRYFEAKVLFQVRVESETAASPSREDDQQSLNLTRVGVGGVLEKKYRYPKLEFLKFDGNAQNWIGFWGMFSKIHDDPLIDNTEKFQFLLQLMVPGSDAAKLVHSYPPSGENYAKAVEQLKSRFAQDKLLIQVYVRELLHLVLQQAQSIEHLRLADLYDKLVSHLRALETLGVTSDKYAAMLYPLVESIIPENTLLAWERSRLTMSSTVSTPSDNDDLKLLLHFLKCEVESEERLNLARSSFYSGHGDRPISSSPVEKNATASSLVSMDSRMAVKGNCVFCQKSSHDPSACTLISDWNLDQKRDHLRKLGSCFVCLKSGHGSSKCRSFIKCLICKKRHSVVMCPKLENPGDPTADSKAKADSALVPSKETLFANIRGTTLLQTLVVRINVGERSVLVRAILDSGSQLSYLKSDVAHLLSPPVIRTETLSHGLFGGIETKEYVHRLFKIDLQGRQNNYHCCVIVRDQDQICSFVPVCDNESYLKLLESRHITLTDTDFPDQDIKLLLGADVLADIITPDVRKIREGLTAVRTKLGWTVMGQVPLQMSNTVLSCTSLCPSELDKLWRLDVLGIEDTAQVKTRQEREVMAAIHFCETVRTNSDNRYVVRLPWIDFHAPLVNNRDSAVRRLMNTTRKLKSTGMLSEYDKIFRDWESTCIIERAVVESNTAFYLPHRPVIKESSLTTKIRPVFDASCKDVRGNSLNNCLEKGPNLVNRIPDLIIKFRLHDIGVTADIAKAFLQIEVDPTERDFLRFLWWENIDSRDLMEYRHCRVVFGVTASPFLLGAVIQHHLGSVPQQYKETAELLKNSWYVDNCVASVKTVPELNRFIGESTEIMSLAKFDLRGWVHSGMESNEEPSVSLLGMRWSFSDDTLFCDVNSLANQPTPLTKRGLLSAAQKLYDPIGFTSPTSLVPKLLLQETWRSNIGWDTELCGSTAKQFSNWLREIPCLAECNLPRKLKESSTCSDLSLHVFADASKLAYAACAFLRVSYGDKVSLALLQSRSRVAPLEATTLPRLELLAALIASRMCKQIRESMKLPDCKEYLWSDSSAAVVWIKKKGNWGVFVRNRCDEINENTDSNDWHHLPGIYNPADLPSRGCNPRALLESKWWEGPKWLLLPEQDWPLSEVEVPTDDVESERRKTALMTVTKGEPNAICEKLDTRFDKFSKLVRCFAWIKRFIQHCQKKDTGVDDVHVKMSIPIRANSGERQNKVIEVAELSASEICEAEKAIWRAVQAEVFGSNNHKAINIQTCKDDEGMLRVKTKLLSGDFASSFKTPILLPANHSIVRKMIFQKHVTNQHAGAATLLCLLREDYWILSGRRTVNQVLSKCVICQRFKSVHADAPAAPLPMERVLCGSVFSVIGIDLAGPLVLRDGAKSWIVIFTCACYRAVHLELVSSLSTEAFMGSLRRFVGRRGRPLTIFADNGTNFRGAANALSTLDWEKIFEATASQRIAWKFNPPSSPWWGGWWERLIRFLKELLRRNLGKSCLSYEELYTVMVDCESLINSRPLTYVSETNDDLVPLTPSLFLKDVVSSDVTDLDILDAQALNKRVRYLHHLRDNLRQRFKREYLSMLIHRAKQGGKAGPSLKPGDVVLVESDNMKRVSWPLARVLELFPGRDGHSRVAKIRTASGELIRPVQRLFPLEVGLEEATLLRAVSKDVDDDAADPANEHDVSDSQDPEEQVVDSASEEDAADDPSDLVFTRRGRPVVPPARLDL